MIEINYLAVFVSALAAMVLGGLWYGPIFGKKWLSLAGITPERMASMPLTPVQAMIGGLLTTLATSYILANALGMFFEVYPMMGADVAVTGALFGFWAWLGFAFPITGGVFLWEGKSWKLWVLTASYYLVSLPLIGVILALWM